VWIIVLAIARLLTSFKFFGRLKSSFAFSSPMIGSACASSMHNNFEVKKSFSNKE
jgi:hypothetical protein